MVQTVPVRYLDTASSVWVCMHVGMRGKGKDLNDCNQFVSCCWPLGSWIILFTDTDMACKSHRSLEDRMMVELGLVFLGKNDMQLVSHSSQMLAGRAFTVRSGFTCNMYSGEDEKWWKRVMWQKQKGFRLRWEGTDSCGIWRKSLSLFRSRCRAI